METEIFLDRWKTAKISSISKGSNRNNRDNYRPFPFYPVCPRYANRVLTTSYKNQLQCLVLRCYFCLTFNPIANSFVDSKPSLYADDIEPHCSHSNLDLAQSTINQDLQRVEQWLADNKMIPNVKKTKSLLIGSREALKKDNEKLDEVSTFDYLGLCISNTLFWKYHVNRLCQRMYPKFGLFNRLLVSTFIYFTPNLQTNGTSCSKLWFNCMARVWNNSN